MLGPLLQLLKETCQTLVAVKQEDRSLFAAFQNTRYRPFAQTLLGKILTSHATKTR